MDKRYGEFTEEEVEIALIHMTRCLNWLLIKEVSVKTSLSCLLSQIRLGEKILKHNRSEYYLQGSEEIRVLIHRWRECKRVQSLWKGI